jgi:hypothetical protein
VKCFPSLDMTIGMSLGSFLGIVIEEQTCEERCVLFLLLLDGFRLSVGFNNKAICSTNSGPAVSSLDVRSRKRACVYCV